MNQESRIMDIKNRAKSIIHDSLFMTRKSAGFTLIELLVAIGIIGVLSSFLLANFVGIRQRARDGVRKSNLSQIQLALEAYRSDQGAYPDNGSMSACGASASLVSGDVVYMKKIPCDPIDNTTPYSYDSPSGNTTYSITACLENEKDSQLDVPKTSCSSTAWRYTVTDP